MMGFFLRLLHFIRDGLLIHLQLDYKVLPLSAVHSILCVMRWYVFKPEQILY